MTSKLSFRARALDAGKPMAIYNQEDLPELESIPAINRAVPALPTGMEKEEESEKHLQDILKSTSVTSSGSSGNASGNDKSSSSGNGKPVDPSTLVIPTPEVIEGREMLSMYAEMYKSDFKLGRQYIHVQPFANDQDNPDYDMDQEDSAFFNDVLKQKFKDENLTELEFEDMIDRLEKNSGHQVVSVRDAKHILSQDDEVIFAVYDYWVDKRLRLKMPLMPTLKSAEINVPSGTSSGSSSQASSSHNNNPYVCFRRRTEKMQTRKNRKNDEASYEKMLKLRRDLNRAVTLLEMVRRREKMKKENLEFGADILEKRYAAQDWDGKIISEIMAGTRIRSAGILQPFAQPDLSNYGMVDESGRKEKRSYRKRKKGQANNASAAAAAAAALASSSGGRGPSSANYASLKNSNGPEFGTSISSDDEALSPSGVEEDELEGPFAFRRKRGCQYLAPIDDFDSCEPVWPWEHEPKYRYSLASLSTPKPRCVGLVRRRIGRGGRVLLDRAYSNHDDLWNSLDFTITESRSDFGMFRPVTPPHCRDEDWDPYKSRLSETSSLPTIPLKPLPFSAVQAAAAAGGGNVSASNTPGRRRAVSGVKTVAVDPVGALNAASALVSNNVLEMFDSNN